MSDVAIPGFVKNRDLSTSESGSGGGFRFLIGLAASAVLGCVLFAISRKLTWGVDEPLLSVWLWLLAIVPYAATAAIVFYLPSQMRGNVVASTALIWTISLACYVGLHLIALSSLIEDPIYSALGLTVGAFILLSFIYAAIAVLVACGFLLIRGRVKHTSQTAAERKAVMAAIAIQSSLSVVLLFAFVFLIPLPY